MNPRLIMNSALLLGFLLTPVACAATPTNVQIEVNFLLGYLEGSGCEFYRNGTWYNAKAAQAHLRDKYNYLLAMEMVHTTEDFIARAATESSISGRPYQVKCLGSAAVTSKQWLGNELARFRSY